jgi:hypothetical protein
MRRGSRFNLSWHVYDGDLENNHELQHHGKAVLAVVQIPKGCTYIH